MHKHVHSKATHRLRVHQFTIQQLGKEVKEGTDLHSTQNPILSMHTHVHSKATYNLRVHQFTTQQVGKGKRRNKLSTITQNPILSMHKECSFKGHLPTESAPVHNIASGQVR